MKMLLRKNMSAHKSHNALTSIIYSLTLGCVIFLLVTANLQIQSISAKSEQVIFGADIEVQVVQDGVAASIFDPIL